MGSCCTVLEEREQGEVQVVSGLGGAFYRAERDRGRVAARWWSYGGGGRHESSVELGWGGSRRGRGEAARVRHYAFKARSVEGGPEEKSEGEGRAPGEEVRCTVMVGKGRPEVEGGVDGWGPLVSGREREKGRVNGPTACSEVWVKRQKNRALRPRQKGKRGREI